jgi:small subunit ribosomal protein S19
MAKIEKFRGLVKEQLENLSMEETMKLVTSRARRALKRAETRNIGFKKLMKKVAMVKTKKPGKIIKTHVRDAVVLPIWVGLTFGVHDGKVFRNVVITPEKVGYRLGDFAHTTGRVLHSGPGIGATRGSKFIPLK